MSVTVDSTVSGASATSYSSVADAVAYLGTQLYGASFAQSTNVDRQGQALIEATSILDLQMYQGDLAVVAQRLKWPRVYVLQPYDPDIIVPPNALPAFGFVPVPRYYDATIIVRPVFEACCELANILYASSADLFSDDATRQVKSERIGPIATEYYDLRYRADGIWRYPKVGERIGPLVLASKQTRIRRG